MQWIDASFKVRDGIFLHSNGSYLVRLGRPARSLMCPARARRREKALGSGWELERSESPLFQASVGHASGRAWLFQASVGHLAVDELIGAAQSNPRKGEEVEACEEVVQQLGKTLVK